VAWGGPGGGQEWPSWFFNYIAAKLGGSYYTHLGGDFGGDFESDLGVIWGVIWGGGFGG
jgi:hypothetical protein